MSSSTDKRNTHKTSTVCLPTAAVIEAYSKLRRIELVLAHPASSSTQRIEAARHHVREVRDLLWKAFANEMGGRIERIQLDDTEL